MVRWQIFAGAIVVVWVLGAAACGSDEVRAPGESITSSVDQAVSTDAAESTHGAEATSATSDTDAAAPSESPTPTPTEEPSAQAGPHAGVAAADIDTDAFPVVLAVAASTNDGMSWRFDVTLSSPYDTPVRYADAWRVLDRNDVELGIRVLGHDHANEQPFTRSQAGILIAEDATVVYVEGHDQANGWSGQRFAFELRR